MSFLPVVKFVELSVALIALSHKTLILCLQLVCFTSEHSFTYNVEIHVAIPCIVYVFYVDRTEQLIEAVLSMPCMSQCDNQL